MKKLYTSLAALILTISVFSQAPEKMSYQAVVRDAENALVKSQVVGMKISIIQGAISGPAVYEETQTPTTNVNGLVSIEVGSGTVESGAFNTIDWSNGPYFIKTETDPTGGTTYTITGTSQLLSVPYALHANTADSIAGGINIMETDPVFESSIAKGITALDTAHWNNHTIDTDTQLDSADIASFGFVAGGITSEIDGSITNELQQLSVNGDTLFISKGNFVVLPGLSNLGRLGNVQQRLDAGESPNEIYQSDHTLKDSLYGKTYGGGFIFYFDSTNGEGLVAGDTTFFLSWGCQGNIITGADARGIGSGLQNTLDILAGCSTSGIAAEVFSNMSFAGYTDWYLPSYEELEQVYLKLHANGIGSYFAGLTWSSTEGAGGNEPGGAQACHFGDAGNEYAWSKANALGALPIRSFQ